MNKVILVGNLTRDPELSTISSGISVCKFGMAVNNAFGSRESEQKEREATFFNIVAWRGLADNCARYLVKGNKVAVSGRIEIRNVEDKEGIKRTYVDIVADDVEFLTPRSQQADGYQPKEHSGNRRVDSLTPVNDDLPF